MTSVVFGVCKRFVYFGESVKEQDDDPQVSTVFGKLELRRPLGTDERFGQKSFL